MEVNGGQITIDGIAEKHHLLLVDCQHRATMLTYERAGEREWGVNLKEDEQMYLALDNYTSMQPFISSMRQTATSVGQLYNIYLLYIFHTIITPKVPTQMLGLSKRHRYAPKPVEYFHTKSPARLAHTGQVSSQRRHPEIKSTHSKISHDSSSLPPKDATVLDLEGTGVCVHLRKL